ADSKDDFAFCVDYQMLINALKTIKNETPLIKVDGKNMIIIHKHGDFKIPLEDHNAFPTSQEKSLDLKSSTNSKHLKRVLKIANKFVLNDNLEPMSNLSIEIGKKTTLRSTNKISLFQETIKGGGDKAVLLISGQASSAMHSLIEDEDDDIVLKYNKTAIFFKFGKKEVTVTQQAGDFPILMFDKIIDSIDDSVDIELDASQFITSIKRVSTLSMREKSQTIQMSLSKSCLDMVCSNSNSSSEVQEQINIKFKGKDQVVGFNSKFFIEILSVFDEKAKYSINSQNCFCIKSKKARGLIAPVVLS
ncbi:MAG TPA: hypothetical protein VFM79_08215, partial [Pelobium sp.]|nr:hypothetical protein [Pelobium sp.]